MGTSCFLLLIRCAGKLPSAPLIYWCWQSISSPQKWFVGLAGEEITENAESKLGFLKWQSILHQWHSFHSFLHFTPLEK